MINRKFSITEMMKSENFKGFLSLEVACVPPRVSQDNPLVQVKHLRPLLIQIIVSNSKIN